MTKKVAIVAVKFNNQIKSFPGIKTIVVDNSPPHQNIGFAAGVNIGIKQALEEGYGRVLLLNPDVKISEKEIITLTANPADIVSPVLKFRRDGKWIYDFGGKVNWVVGGTTHNEVLQGETLQPRRVSPYEVDYVSGACMLIKKEVFEKIGFFDEKFFMYFEDVDFCLRARTAGFTISVDQNLIVEHAIDEQRKSHNLFKMKQNVKSNWIFINKWISWYFKPFAIGYMITRWIRETYYS